MNWWLIILIVLLGVILLGPIMLGFAKLNHVNPYIFEEENPENDERSLILVSILRPLFVPLWLETKLIRWIKTKFSKKL